MIKIRGYLTVYLTLCLTIILSLYLVLIDGARRNGAALVATCAAEAGFQSIMAEYHRELFRQYNILAVDFSYGSSNADYQNTCNHLQEYVAKNLSCDELLGYGLFYKDLFELDLTSATVDGLKLLTDQQGEIFRSNAVNSLKADMGAEYAKQLAQWLEVININGLAEKDCKAEKDRLDSELDRFDGKEIQISGTESVTVHVENPVKDFEQKRASGLLRLVLDKDVYISNKEINEENLAKRRLESKKANIGNMPGENTSDRILFQEYLMRYMECFGSEKTTDNALSYEIEYLLGGQERDETNLNIAVERIAVIREAANVMYLISDEEKMAEIRAAAILACGALLIPELEPIMEGIILLGWASIESVCDVRNLLDGGKVPILKTKATWNSNLEDALEGKFGANNKQTSGLSYKDYLMLLLTVSDLETITYRAMNIVEANIRLTEGNKLFRLDACFTDINATVKIESAYGYQYELTRTRKYM